MKKKPPHFTHANEVSQPPAGTVVGGPGFNQFNGAEFDGAEVFRSLQISFEKAKRQFPEDLEESYFRFGGHSVRFRILGRELAEHILRPFAHLRIDNKTSVDAELTIDLWDENATKIRGYFGPRESCRSWTDVTSISSDGRFIGQLQPNSLTCFDRTVQHIVGSVAWSPQIFIYERAKPLSRLLLEWNNDRNIQIIHAGLVVRDGKGVLFVAKSGSGKSTASLACLCAGFDYVGEDFIGLERQQDGAFVGHSLYNSVFLETGHLSRFPELLPYVTRGAPHEEKAVVILSQVFPERIKPFASIDAVVLPRVANAESSHFKPVSRSRALLALGPSSLIEIPSRGMEGFTRLAQLVEQVPTYEMELGRDLESIPRSLDVLIAEITQH